MTIYFILIAYVLLLPFVMKLIIPDYDLRQKWIIFLDVLALFLLFALKSSTVGIDISGYEEQYYISKYVSWSDYDYVFFEHGYTFLEKLFSKMGFSFQFFAGLIYLTECVALALLIKKFSRNVTISIMMFICYQTLVLSMSALRQVLAMSLCLFAFLLFYKRKLVPTVLGVLIVVASLMIHSSAYIFFVIPLLIYYCDKKPNFSPGIFVFLLLFSVLGRSFIWNTINTVLKEVDTEATMTLRGNFVFLVILMLFCLFTYENYYGLGFFGRKTLVLPEGQEEERFNDSLCLRIVELCVIGQLMFSGGTLLRSINYYVFILTAFLPGMIEKYRREQRLVIQVVLIVMLIILFYTQTLAVNQMDIGHYKFFWEHI